MGISCGTQVVLCEYPIRLDTYRGCSHGCKYCFAQMKTDIDIVKPENCVKSLVNFINGKRTKETNWCDWKIPLHWGGLSDPFQPCEADYGVSLEALKIFAETKYPVIVSTKGKLITKEPYLSLVRDANIVVQISMACSSYDKLEPGAPTFEERLEMIKALDGKANKIVCRIQPFICNVGKEIVQNIPRMAKAGADAVTVEGMKFKKKKPGLVKEAVDWCYPESVLVSYYEQIKDACHNSGIEFYCAENRLRKLGDGLACCGCGNVSGFEGNSFNAVSLINGSKQEPSEKMKEKDTARCFCSLYQTTVMSRALVERSFEEMQLLHKKKLLENK